MTVFIAAPLLIFTMLKGVIVWTCCVFYKKSGGGFVRVKCYWNLHKNTYSVVAMEGERKAV
tara:strand:+ start:312 stop:494 length:183 start_codon:yes stop_codon:yes gene_type:complete